MSIIIIDDVSDRELTQEERKALQEWYMKEQRQAVGTIRAIKGNLLTVLAPQKLEK